MGLGEVIGFGGTASFVIVLIGADTPFLVPLKQVEALEGTVACRAVEVGYGVYAGQRDLMMKSWDIELKGDL
jgi:hypothetical protein